jgi:hypothetical protein
MRSRWTLGLLLLAGCGIESLFLNAGHEQYDRPASKVIGTAPEEIPAAQMAIIDGEGTELEPFRFERQGAGYEMRLPSSRYSMLRVRARSGNLELRAIVPAVNEESEIAGVDLDARNMTETLIVEARLSADRSSLGRVTAEAYLGTRALIRAELDVPGSDTHRLLQMVERVIAMKYDPSLSVPEPQFFNAPDFCRTTDVEPACTGTPLEGTDWVKQTSPIDAGFLLRNPFDYAGDGRAHNDSVAFDTLLARVAQSFRPAGCPDAERIRVLFTVDFNEGAKNGNCGNINRFRWATDRPGKTMFFVGWIYDGSAGLAPSDISDPRYSILLGSSTPNVIPMYDDGTNGDATAGDNIFSIYFDLPRAQPGRVFRMGYKYTWGTQGAVWSGSEEWPGNSRILEVVDDNGDDFVYRRDVFGDEATNKDKANASNAGTGSIDWTTDNHGCGTPESHENEFDNNSCMCGSVLTPDWIGPLTVTCTQ